MLFSILVKKFFDSVKYILENVKIFIFVVNKSICYLLFRVYSMEELMIKTPTTTAATRMERSESGLQFLILRLFSAAQIRKLYFSSHRCLPLDQRLTNY